MENSDICIISLCEEHLKPCLLFGHIWQLLATVVYHARDLRSFLPPNCILASTRHFLFLLPHPLPRPGEPLFISCFLETDLVLQVSSLLLFLETAGSVAGLLGTAFS